MIARVALRGVVLRAFPRYYSGGVSQSKGTSSSSTAPTSSTVDVAGLSSAVVAPAIDPVGPNVDPKKTGAYKVPEYYCYNESSFYEAEVEMSKFRLPQPDATKH